jgi:anthranilate/para-aminobenzoate synthase component II
VVDASSVPDVLEVTAQTADGVVMGLRHRTLPIEGVQFHPESILTTSGHHLLGNFLARSQAKTR